MKIAKLSKKKIIFTGIIAVLLIFAASKIFFKNEQPSFNIIKVERGNMVQEVSESGVVKIGQDLTLGFRSGGKVEKIYVNVGDEVKAGQILAKLDSTQLSIQIQEASANLNAAQAQLRIGQTAVLNAQTALVTAQQNSSDIAASAQIGIANSYQDALNASEDAYLKIFGALDSVKTVRDLYFTAGDQEGINVTFARNSISNALLLIKDSLDSAKANPSSQKIDGLLLTSIDSLESTFSALTTVRQTAEVSIYKDSVSSANKTILDNHRTNINTSLTAVVNAQQAIASTKPEALTSVVVNRTFPEVIAF